MDQFSILQLDQQMVIDSLAPPSCPAEPLFTTPVKFVVSTISGLSPTRYSQSLQIGFPLQSVSTSMLCLPRTKSPQSTRTQAVQFFLNYHQRTITEAHYFRWHDLPKFSTKLIFSIAEESSALQHSLVAFSALIYSIKVHQGVRTFAFMYYAKALQELRLFLNETSMTLTDCYVAVATALQLSSFDVDTKNQGFLIVAVFRRCGKMFSSFGRCCTDHVITNESSSILFNSHRTLPSRMVYAIRRLLLFPRSIQTITTR